MSKTAASALLTSDSTTVSASVAAALDIEGNNPVNLVQVEALVVMKIIKHSREASPDLATGQLLGLDVETTLEITNCYPAPSGDSEDSTQYQMDMMQCLREVNTDNNAVGWYQSVHFNTVLDHSILEMQYNYQKNLKKSALLAYDLSRSTRGNVALRAFRLAPAFMDIYKKGEFTAQTFSVAGLSHSNILEEIPLVIHNTSLLNVLMYELDEQNAPVASLEEAMAAPSPLANSLDLCLDPCLEKNIEVLLDSLDRFNSTRQQYQHWQRSMTREQQKIQQYQQRRRLENAARTASGQEPLPEESEAQVAAMFPLPKEPSRLNHLVATGKVENYCKQLNQFGGPTFAKLFTVRELQN
ncbi:hypothetical protein IWQ61_009600 [Dispira simplex]|nr:hypothetical protein IWQ61_009600 [Dispira simplex]